MTTAAKNGAGQSNRPALEGFSLDVRLWNVTKAQSKTRPYQLRWKVGGKVKSATFATTALAQSRKSELWLAMKRGEAFRIQDGLPESEVRAAEEAAVETQAESTPNWWEFSREYLATRWRAAAAKTREGLADSLATAALAMMGEAPNAPDLAEVRLAVRWVVVPAHKGEEPPQELRSACAWLAEHSLPVSALRDTKVARDVHHRLSFKLDETPAAADTYQRRRRGFNTAMNYAIQEGYLEENPLAGMKRPAGQGSGEIDPRTLMNAVQGQQLLIAVSYVGSVHRNRGRRLVAFFGCILYAAMRPAEGVGLKRSDCELPEEGWGVLTLHETRPVSGKKWTDSGERHDRRGLKSREKGRARRVPIPPVLVAMLRAHLEEFGTAPDGRVFHNERGGLLGSSSYWRVWQEARPYAFPPPKMHILATKPYEGRATCITDWLRSDLPVAEVARRAGNSPEVIHRRYAGIVDDSEDENNKKIEKTMGWSDEGAAEA
ncbi:site-specific integrase [Streptomyces olivoreticuli]